MSRIRTTSESIKAKKDKSIFQHIKFLKAIEVQPRDQNYNASLKLRTT